jgi:hypothetical protein
MTDSTPPDTEFGGIRRLIPWAAAMLPVVHATMAMALWPLLA